MLRGGRDRRRRRKAAEASRDDEFVDLSSEEHAWWAGRDDLDAGVPRGRTRLIAEPDAWPQGGFEHYFSTESLFDPNIEAPHVTPEHDPYAVLGVRETATWREITGAHRRLAKIHHPDRLVDPTAEQRTHSETRIRDLNIAYTELRRRRGM